MRESGNFLRDGFNAKRSSVEEQYFSKFLTLDDPQLTRLRDAGIQYCLDMASKSKPAYWLVLAGVSGTGKTHIAKSCVRFFTRNLDMLRDETKGSAGKTHYVRRGGFKNWPEAMIEMIGGDYTGLRQLCDDWLVCLDDIGAEYAGNRELSNSKLYEVFTAREGKFTIVTSNLSVKQISETLDRRLASRLLRNGSVVIDVQTQDFNCRKK